MRRRSTPEGLRTEAPASPVTGAVVTPLAPLLSEHEQLKPPVQQSLPVVPATQPAQPAATPSPDKGSVVDGRLPEMGMGVERIVRSVFDFPDTESEYYALRKALKFEERASAMSHGQLIDELERCADFVMRAAQLLAVVKVVHADLDQHGEIILSPMRQEALESLQLENDRRKAEKLSTKTVTNADVEAEMRRVHPDEYKDLTRRLDEAKRMVGVVERLADAWQERARDLRAMVSRSRAE